jgi:hypothetical protein
MRSRLAPVKEKPDADRLADMRLRLLDPPLEDFPLALSSRWRTPLWLLRRKIILN